MAKYHAEVSISGSSLKKATTDEGISLLADNEAASFQRFLFVRLFHADSLLTKGGLSALLKLVKDQRFQEKEIEKAVNLEYRAYRERWSISIKHNPKFPGTKGRLVRLAQKLIDRCIFVMFCEAWESSSLPTKRTARLSQRVEQEHHI